MLIIALWDSYIIYPHFTDEETEDWRGRDFAQGYKARKWQSHIQLSTQYTLPSPPAPITCKAQEPSTPFLFFLIFFLTLQYCIGFAIYQPESATGIHVFPILNPPLSSLPVPSLWVVPVHQPQASSIVHRTWTGNSFHIWYYTYFNAILPNPNPNPNPYFITETLFK